MAKQGSRISPFQRQCFVTMGMCWNILALGCVLQAPDSTIPVSKEVSSWIGSYTSIYLHVRTVCWNILALGCVLGYPAVLLQQLQAPDSTIPVSKEVASWIGSYTSIYLHVRSVCRNILALGCVLGYPAVLLQQLQAPDSTIPVSKEVASWIGSYTSIYLHVRSVCWNILALGCVLGYPAVLLQQLQAPDSTIPVSKEVASWIGSYTSIYLHVRTVCWNILALGCVLGYPAMLLQQLQAPDFTIPVSKEVASWIGSYTSIYLHVRSVCWNILALGCVLGYPAVLLQQLQAPDSTIPVSKEVASWIGSYTSIYLHVRSLCWNILALGYVLGYPAVLLQQLQAPDFTIPVSKEVSSWIGSYTSIYLNVRSVCWNILGLGCVLGYPAVLLQQLQALDSTIPVSKEVASWIGSYTSIYLHVRSVCWNILALGYVLSYPAVLLQQLQAPDSTIPVSKEVASWIGSYTSIYLHVRSVCWNILALGCVLSYPAVLQQLQAPDSTIPVSKEVASWIGSYTSIYLHVRSVCWNILALGCVLGYPAVLLQQLHSPDSTIPVSKEVASWIASVMPVTMVAGNFLAPPIMGRLGRRAAHLAVSVPLVLGWLAVLSASGYEMLIVGRVLHGISYGMNLPLRSVLVAEYSSPRHRGAFLALVSLAQSVGLFLVHLLGSLLPWTRTALLCVSFTALSVLMMLFAPESPSYLAAKGRYDDCTKAFLWLRGDDEMEELEKMIETQKYLKISNADKKNGFKDTLETIKKPEFYKPIFIMLHAYAMVEFAGGNTMAAYSTVIIGILMGPGANVNHWMTLLDAQRIVTNSIAVYFINRYRRRVLLFSIGALSVGAYVGMAGYVWLGAQCAWLAAALLNAHVFTLATGMVPLPSVIAGEVFPLEYRSISAALSSFLVLKTFPGLVESIHLSGTFAVYAAFITYFLAVMWFTLPETKSRTLQDIEDEFKGVHKIQVVEMNKLDSAAEKEPLQKENEKLPVD